MRLDRLTNKTREAIVTAQGDAQGRGNPEIYPEHLLVALFEADESLAQSILKKAFEGELF